MTDDSDDDVIVSYCTRKVRRSKRKRKYTADKFDQQIRGAELETVLHQNGIEFSDDSDLGSNSDDDKCECKGPPGPVMLNCSGQSCTRKFHYECAGIDRSKNVSMWYCPKCNAARKCVLCSTKQSMPGSYFCSKSCLKRGSHAKKVMKSRDLLIKSLEASKSVDTAWPNNFYVSMDFIVSNDKNDLAPLEVLLCLMYHGLAKNVPVRSEAPAPDQVIGGILYVLESPNAQGKYAEDGFVLDNLNTCSYNNLIKGCTVVEKIDGLPSVALPADEDRDVFQHFCRRSIWTTTYPDVIVVQYAGNELLAPTKLPYTSHMVPNETEDEDDDIIEVLPSGQRLPKLSKAISVELVRGIRDTEEHLPSHSEDPPSSTETSIVYTEGQPSFSSPSLPVIVSYASLANCHNREQIEWNSQEKNVEFYTEKDIDETIEE